MDAREGTGNMQKAAAEKIIRDLAESLNVSIGDIQTPADSHLGTKSFCAHVTDGKGIIYCHASGDREGEAFYVPKGIGWFYKKILSGSQSSLGLPVSNEEIEEDIITGKNLSVVHFEDGCIKYDPDTSICRAMRFIGDEWDGREVFEEMKL